jgi:hypothetical protein
MGLISAEGKKLECFKRTGNNCLEGHKKTSKPVLRYSDAGILSHSGCLYVYTKIPMTFVLEFFIQSQCFGFHFELVFSNFGVTRES